MDREAKEIVREAEFRYGRGTRDASEAIMREVARKQSRDDYYPGLKELKEAIDNGAYRESGFGNDDGGKSAQENLDDYISRQRFRGD